MALNNSGDSIQAQRRAKVARLRLRGLTQREIQVALCHPTSGMLNPATNEPFSLGTINTDCKALDTEWRKDMAEINAIHKERLWAEIQEVRREAWRDKDMAMVLKAMKQEIDLFGLEAPKKTELAGQIVSQIIMDV